MFIPRCIFKEGDWVKCTVQLESLEGSFTVSHEFLVTKITAVPGNILIDLIDADDHVVKSISQEYLKLMEG